MFRLIVVPLDGTPFAEQAVPTAVMLARAGEGRLLLAHVHLPPPPSLGADALVVVDADMLTAIETAARTSLDATTRRVAEHAGVPVESVFVEATVAHRALHGVAASRGADLIVMASRHRGALGRLFAGSVAERLAHEPGIPVLLVHQGDASDAAAPPFRNVLVPLDGSALAEAVLGPATRLARACGAAITLVTVHDAFLAAAGVPDHAAGQAYMDGVARRLRADGFTVHLRETRDGNAAHAIARCAAEAGADVIAMSTHGRGGLARLLAGSVADGVLHTVLIPVLVFHPADVDRGRHRDAPDASATPGGVPPPA